MNCNDTYVSRKALINSPVGVLELREEEGKIVEISFSPKKKSPSLSSCLTGILKQCALELEEYFRGKRRDFSVPLNLRGTPFRQKVWKALRQIPYGETRSYEEVAFSVGNIKACRAVGGANHHNPVPIIVPCHRVIGKGGNLTGFGGGLEIKHWLLNHEKAHCSGGADMSFESAVSL